MKNKPGEKCASCSSPIVATLCKPMPAFFTAAFTVLMALQVGHAHREDYIDETLVFETLEKGEFEPEYWLDLGFGGISDFEFQRHHLVLETGLTGHLMVEGRVAFIKTDGEDFEPEGWRVETRYRFGEEGRYPVDVAISGEINQEMEAGESHLNLEPRIIFSKDYAASNFTLNLAEDIPLSDEDPEFHAKLAGRHDFENPVSVGIEFAFRNGRFGSMMPQMKLDLPYEVTFKTGWSFGFREGESDFLRLVLEREF